MAIEGPFVDRSNPDVTAHAVQRFGERFEWQNAQEKLRQAFLEAEELLPQRWWRLGWPSYWINARLRMVIVCRQHDGRLSIITVLHADGDTSIGSKQVAQALSQWQKEHRVTHV